MNRNYFYFLLFTFGLYIIGSLLGCAQIGMPTGGDRDSIAPVLLSAVPALKTTNFTGNKIVLNFDEYIDLQDVQKNVLISPLQKNIPTISFKLKTVTVKLKDSLLPNTTYAINFGNAIKDNNEGNPFKNFTYVFSTGNTIDSLLLSGQVILAESGKTDSTMVAILYRNVPDSAVKHSKPNYLAKLDGEGKFTFTNLSAGQYKLYALKDDDGSKTYNSTFETFAFNDSDIVVSANTKSATMYAFAQEIEKKKTPAVTTKNTANTKLKYSTSLSIIYQDLLNPLQLSFNNPIKNFDSTKIFLTDSSFNKILKTSFSIDSTNKIISLQTKWNEDFDYRLILQKDAVTDTSGNQLLKADTIKFKSKRQSEYGNLVIHFSNYKAGKHKVLQFYKGETLYKSIKITSAEWADKLFEPGEYELRILEDSNNNGLWDPGNYSKKIQPEIVTATGKNLTVKANWDNEREVEL